MFKITNGKGFQITFANGYTVSIQFGWRNYCENRNYFPATPERGASKDAEIAVWGPDGAFISCGDDDVRGWVSADEVAQFIAWARAIDPRSPPKRVPDFGEADCAVGRMTGESDDEHKTLA